MEGRPHGIRWCDVGFEREIMAITVTAASQRKSELRLPNFYVTIAGLEKSLMGLFIITDKRLVTDFVACRVHALKVFGAHLTGLRLLS